MKRAVVVLVVICVAFLAMGDAFAGEKPRLGVLRFTNETHAGWWGATAGRDLQDMLIAELAAMKVFDVLERKELDAVIAEQDMGASGRVDKGTRAKVGKITGAQYLVAGTVSAFEHNTGSTGGGIGFKGFRIGGDKEKAYMAIDLKVIDVNTGKIVDARTVEASSKSGGVNLGYSGSDFSGDLANQKKTPVGKAIRACIMEAADYLECSMVKGKGDSCMQEFDAKESARKEKTKGSIDLE